MSKAQKKHKLEKFSAELENIRYDIVGLAKVHKKERNRVNFKVATAYAARQKHNQFLGVKYLVNGEIFGIVNKFSS